MECDLLFSIGTRFNDRITGDLNEFAPHAQIVHIDVDTASISRNVVVDVPVVADAGVALEKLLEWAEKKDTAKWQEQIHRWEKENPLAMRRDRGISPQMIMEHINAQFPHSIYVTDVGQHQIWNWTNRVSSSHPADWERWDSDFRPQSEQKLQIQRNRSCVSREMADFR